MISRVALGDVKYSEIVAVSLERALSETSIEVWRNVEEKLLSDYDVKFTDCFEHPEILKELLEKYYPHLFAQIINAFIGYRSEFNIDENLRGFLEKLHG